MDAKLTPLQQVAQSTQQGFVDLPPMDVETLHDCRTVFERIEVEMEAAIRQAEAEAASKARAEALEEAAKQVDPPPHPVGALEQAEASLRAILAKRVRLLKSRGVR